MYSYCRCAYYTHCCYVFTVTLYYVTATGNAIIDYNAVQVYAQLWTNEITISKYH